MIKANILRILTMLIRTYQDESKSGEMLKEKKSAMKRLEQAISYIDHHYSEKITLDEVAAAAYMSSNYFSSYFRKVTGISFSEYGDPHSYQPRQRTFKRYGQKCYGNRHGMWIS